MWGGASENGPGLLGVLALLPRPIAPSHAIFRTFCCNAAVLVRVDSSMAKLSPANPLTILFFCRFSSLLFFRSSTMLSSRLRRASSTSMPFLNPFLRLSTRFMVDQMAGCSLILPSSCWE